MRRLVISSDDLACVSETGQSAQTEVQLPSPVPWSARILLAPLVVILPLLGLASLFVWLSVRDREPRIRHGWIHYCFTLLIISSFITSVGVGFAFFNWHFSVPTFAPASGPEADVPFTADIPSSTEVPPAAGFSPRELARVRKPAVYIVSREVNGFRPPRNRLAAIGFGTGVLLQANNGELLVATNRHVLDGEHWERSRPYSGPVLVSGEKGGYARAEIAGRHKKLDLLLLRVSHKTDKSFTQPILPFSQIESGEPILTFGHPEGLFFSLSNGLVSRTDGGSQIQITAPVGPGASGGPVYDMHGRLLGIITSMLSKATNPQAENLNFAVRADAFLTLNDWDLDAAGERSLSRFISTQSTSASPAPKEEHAAASTTP